MALILFEKIANLFKSESKIRSDDIDKQLLQESQFFIYRTHDNLIMGAPRSGKTTFFKQLKRIYLDNGAIDNKCKVLRRQHIRTYVIDSIIGILADKHLPLTSLKKIAVAKWLRNNLSKYGFKCFENYHNMPKNFFNLGNFVNILWEDEAIRKYIQSDKENHLENNVDYFLDKIGVIFNDDYLPTDEDVLKCPSSSNMEELCLYLSYDGVTNKYIFIDTNSRKFKLLGKFFTWNRSEHDPFKNLPRPETVKFIIIFIVDCSTPKQLYYSFFALESVVHCSYGFCYKIYVVLNKVDLFKRRIFAGETLQNFFREFPEFPSFINAFDEHFQPRTDWEREEDRRVVAGLNFIIQKIEIDHEDYYDRYFMLNHVLCGSYFSGVVNDLYVRRIIYDCCLYNRNTLLNGRLM